ncbi:MAG: hypothetical protein ACOVVK_01515 [Elsteraceae bacterium]
MQHITEHDVADIHLAAPSEARIFAALNALMEALSGPRGDIAVAAEKYLTRGFPDAPKPTTQGVVLDMLVQLLWLAATLHVDIGAELERLTREHEIAAARSREEKAIIEKQQANRAVLGGGLETPQGRCLTILAYGVNLRPEPKDGTWTWRKAVFPDQLIQLLLAGGLVSVEGDGASSTYLAITPRGLAAYNKLSGEQVEAEGALPNIPPASAASPKSAASPAPAPSMAPAMAEPEDPMADFDHAFEDDPMLDPEEKPFRFS